MTANPEKQYYVPGYASYLRNLHSIDRVGGVRSSYRILSGLTGYERMRTSWSAREDSVRWMVQSNNCRNHPLFEKLIDFIILGDEKYALGTKWAEGLEFLFSGREEFLVNVLGLQSFGTAADTLRRWETMPVVKYLRTLRT
uniref:RdRp n=1 Tax=viral metagenome TaxID=1070528 RepID=A0A2V0RA16_9ZZZZ